MTLLSVEDVHAGYDGFLVLRGASLTVDDEEIVCVIGPNGAGKSTLFKTVYGLLSPNRGTITYDGEDITSRSQKQLLKSGISYVLQRNAAFPDMTVRDNLELGAYVAGSTHDTDAAIEDVFDIFPALQEYADTPAGNLSGGQQQMVELGRGMMLDPDLLMLDEPTAGLAPKAIDMIFEKIEDINARGVTILMIEQNVKTGVKHSDHVFVLENGSTRFDGDAEKILERPEIREAYLKVDRGQ
ncbi:ABC transporter ATP-binding protein [Haloquadratum walsbyi]|jgi:ABC-type branched-chain amino acid transport systems, ATPase component|uniref:ABC-type branched-chain amino acid transport system, ATPase component n=1 Tax=Haloquadratum walsbyi J07HQW2 TaxID=1238425 RepID=U1PTQ1_9EURY|nr:ABC transporter ATP-binding protein [Haloquadratum walsbyi]ERG97182.1 MAG: ABC-type branched-chain amino acid transport system, ATPase component [Haloquadratum walsbyi J07HQW2]